jgi:prepilin-type N-terminal cleavage/methylation domain-containing protein
MARRTFERPPRHTSHHTPHRILPATPSSQRGLSLVELMITLAIGLLILAATLSVFLGSRENACLNDSLGRVQENARVAFAAIGDEVYKAGYRSDPSRPIGEALNAAAAWTIAADTISLRYRRYVDDDEPDGIIADCLGAPLDTDEIVTTAFAVADGRLRCTSTHDDGALEIVGGVDNLQFTQDGNALQVQLDLSSGTGNCALSQQFTSTFSLRNR